MALFGTDEPVLLRAEDLVESARIQEATSSKALVAFTVKKYSTTDRSAVTNLLVHNALTLSTKQMTQMERGHGVANPEFALNLPGVEDSVLFLKRDGQIWSLPLDGGTELREQHKLSISDINIIGEASKVSCFPVGVESFKIFRGDATKIWLLCVLGVYPNMTPAETVAHDAEIAREGTSGMVCLLA